MQLHIIPGITRGHNSRIYVQTVFENGSICFVDRDKGYTDKKRMEERMRAVMDSNQKALVRATSAEVIVRQKSALLVVCLKCEAIYNLLTITIFMHVAVYST